MALRKGWDNLSEKQRNAYIRAGITRESYNAGANLEAARRGRFITPAGGGREAALLKAKRAAQTPERKAQIREREKTQRAQRITDRRAESDRLLAWSKEHGKTPATQFRAPGLPANKRPTNRDLERKEVIQYLTDYGNLIRELEKGWFGTRQGRFGGDAQVIDDYFKKYGSVSGDASFDKYRRRFE